MSIKNLVSSGIRIQQLQQQNKELISRINHLLLKNDLQEKEICNLKRDLLNLQFELECVRK